MNYNEKYKTAEERDAGKKASDIRYKAKRKFFTDLNKQIASTQLMNAIKSGVVEINAIYRGAH